MMGTDEHERAASEWSDVAKVVDALGYRPAAEVAEECAQIAEGVADRRLIGRYLDEAVTAIRAAFPTHPEAGEDS